MEITGAGGVAVQGTDVSEKPEEENGDEHGQHALRTTHIIDSVNYVHEQDKWYIPLFEALNIVLEMAIERAYRAAVRPADSPSGWKEAMARADRDEWIKAAQIEINALIENSTWELVELPAGRRAIGSCWVFLVKRQANGEIERYKARLVARGDNQRPGVDYDQVFAPTARLAALWSILALAALAGEHIESIDISNAYLNGELENLNGELEKEHDVYMRQLEGFQRHGPNGEQWVCRLIKGLYGLKQSGRLWYHKLAETLEAMGFTQIRSDPSIYVWITDGIRVILPVFVDDITLVSKDAGEISKVKNALRKTFKIKDLGPSSYLLGIKIDYDRENRIMKLSQRQYIIDMLNHFRLSECNPVTTPMDPSAKLSKAMCPKSEEEREEMRNVPYMNAVGALMYLAIGTHPDIAYAVGKLAQYNNDPGRQHWQAVKHIFHYLKGTMDLKLTYSAMKSPIASHLFITYSDSDHAGCLDTRQSVGGYVVKVGTGAVSWSSKKQSTVALSSTEAEYIATVAAGKEMLWMRSLLKELHFRIDEASPMFVDNRSALTVLMDPQHHGRMKHLDINMHWIRDVVKRGTIAPHHVPSDDNTADIFTKALPRLLVERHHCALGIL